MKKTNKVSTKKETKTVFVYVNRTPYEYGSASFLRVCKENHIVIKNSVIEEDVELQSNVEIINSTIKRKARIKQWCEIASSTIGVCAMVDSRVYISQSTVETNARIYRGCSIYNSFIGKEARVESMSELTNCTLSQECQVGRRVQLAYLMAYSGCRFHDGSFACGEPNKRIIVQKGTQFRSLNVFGSRHEISANSGSKKIEIGCTELSYEEWFGEEGRRAATVANYTQKDRAVYRKLIKAIHTILLNSDGRHE